MLDYAALAALAAVIKEGSFEKAARALHVTPSAVSQRIRLLEERIGCALVLREVPCKATAMGQRLCRHVGQVQLLEHDLLTSVPALAPAGVPAAPVPVAVNADSLATWFGVAAAAYAAETPVLLELHVDDQDHTAGWLRDGVVLAAVTSLSRPAAGCNSHPLGRMRYVAAASPAFMARHFAGGIDAKALARAPSLVFNAKDELQARWVRRVCGGKGVVLPRHTVPSPDAFVTAALAGMGWGMQPHALALPHLAAGRLVELVPGQTLDVPLHWQHARAASSLLDGLTKAVVGAAKGALLTPA
jgi:LysR family transcriptional regulator (chromosome initiation inhibitor)